jgi:hypothetical protein
LTIPHHLQYRNITEAILGFAEYARSCELNVGIRESHEALEIVSTGLIEDKKNFRFALKSLFCSSEENTETFDTIFDLFWGGEKAEIKSKIEYKNQSNIIRKSSGSLVMMNKGSSTVQEEEEGKNVSGANSTEQLRKTDFSKVSDIESEHLNKLAEDLWKQMSKRLRKKFRKSVTRGKLDLRQTIRSNISKGGEMLDLHYKEKKPDKNRLIILLDVSGSMDKYSFFLLRFILSLRSHFKHIDAYIFSTKLIRITEYLEIKNLQSVLEVLSHYADNWSSGTKIGECLGDFNRKFAKRSLTGKNMTIILSDGLDTGEPELLVNELQKVKLRTRRLIWLNPLKGMKGYVPRTRSMVAALPEIDHFMSAHSINSLLELENILYDAN